MKKHFFFILLMPFAGFPVYAQKPASAGQRLVAQSYYEASGSGFVLSDTAHYTFSGTRTSRFDYNNLLYIDLYLIGSAPVADLINLHLPTNNIDSSDFPLVDFDSAYLKVHIGSPDMLTCYEGHTYTANGGYDRVNNQVYSGTPPTLTYGQRSINVYASGLLRRAYTLSYNAGLYDTSFIHDYLYDGSGRIYLDSLTARMGPNNYVGFARITYTYSGAGAGFTTFTQATYRSNPSRLVTIGRTTNTYYPDGKVKTAFYESSFSGGTLQPTGTDSFGYTPGVQGYTYRQQLDANTGPSGYNYFTRTVHINAANQKDSVTFSGYQGTTLQDVGSTAIEYDAAGYPITRRDYNVGVNPRLYSVEHYYYENYGAGAGVPPLSQITFTVSPNPTTGVVTLSCRGAKPEELISVVITNAIGQPVHTEVFRLQGNPQQIMLGAEAPAGIYYIAVHDHSGIKTVSQQIIKL